MTSWYCNISDETIIVKKNLNNLILNLINTKKIGVVGKEYEFVRPDKNDVDYIIKKCARDRYNKCFHRFKFRCIYDFEMTNG